MFKRATNNLLRRVQDTDDAKQGIRDFDADNTHPAFPGGLVHPAKPCMACHEFLARGQLTL